MVSEPRLRTVDRKFSGRKRAMAIWNALPVFYPPVRPFHTSLACVRPRLPDCPDLFAGRTYARVVQERLSDMASRAVERRLAIGLMRRFDKQRICTEAVTTGRLRGRQSSIAAPAAAAAKAATIGYIMAEQWTGRRWQRVELDKA